MKARSLLLTTALGTALGCDLDPVETEWTTAGGDEQLEAAGPSVLAGPAPMAGSTCLESVGRSCPPDSVVNWDNFAGPFFARWCTGCHNPTGREIDALVSWPSPAFDMLPSSRIEALAVPIYQAAGDESQRMPLGAEYAVSDTERKLLGDWLACCMPGLPGH